MRIPSASTCTIILYTKDTDAFSPISLEQRPIEMHCTRFASSFAIPENSSRNFPGKPKISQRSKNHYANFKTSISSLPIPPFSTPSTALTAKLICGIFMTARASSSSASSWKEWLSKKGRSSLMRSLLSTSLSSCCWPTAALRHCRHSTIFRNLASFGSVVFRMPCCTRLVCRRSILRCRVFEMPLTPGRK